MGSLSYRAGTEGKHNKKNLAKASAHTYRKTEQKYKKHGNEKIDMDKTKYNNDWTITGETIEKIVEDKIANEYTGKKALRKDAVVIREIIVQASPEIYEGLTIEEQQEKSAQFTKDTYDFLCDEFGKDNILGYSEHLDETNPHTHFSIMPMTSDGRLSQKDFFKGPSGLKRQHRQYREHMNDAGWDFDTENKFDEQEAIPLAKFKKNAAAIIKLREDNQKMLDELKADPNIEDIAVQAIINEIGEDVRMQQLDERQKQLDEEHWELLDKWDLLDAERAKFEEYKANERQSIEDDYKRREEAIRAESERVAYLTGFAEYVGTDTPKMATREDADRLLSEATGGEYRVLMNNKTKMPALAAKRQGTNKYHTVSAKDIVASVYDMQGQDFVIDTTHDETQKLSYALGKYKHIGESVSDSAVYSDGFEIVGTAAYEKQKELERDKTL